MSPQNLPSTLAPGALAVVPATLSSFNEGQQVRVAGHDLTIYVETWSLIKAMVEDIRAARQRVWLETYIFLNDAAGKAIAEALKERARAGVEVRLLYDAIGSQTTLTSFFGQLQRAGVKVHAYHSLWEAFWRFSPLRVLNHRDHRKLLVIDDHIAYFGGMNIVDVSNPEAAAQAKHHTMSAGWRDVHVRLAGPQQGEIAASFDRSWRRARGETLPPSPREQQPAQITDDESESIQFFDSGPRRRQTRAGRLFSRLIHHARSKVTLSMAYFLPVGRVLRMLLAARKRGIFVRVVVPANSDVPVVQYAARHLFTRLLRRRFHIYERLGNMLHSKVMIVDDRWTVLGSTNMDARSLWINLEFIALIHSRKLAQVMNDIVAYDMAHSKRVQLREFREQSWWRRLRDRLAWALRWWL
jgi:cardiolipin synthase A/B